MKCQLCGCTDEKACRWPGVGACWWVIEGVPVCSRCWCIAPPIALVHVIFGKEAVKSIEAMLAAPVFAGEADAVLEDIDPAALRQEILP